MSKTSALYSMKKKPKQNIKPNHRFENKKSKWSNDPYLPYLQDFFEVIHLH